MIWLSVNLDCFIAELSSSLVENSTFNPAYLLGGLPMQHIVSVWNQNRAKLILTAQREHIYERSLSTARQALATH